MSIDPDVRGTLREEFPEVVVPRSNKANTLHIPDEDEPGEPRCRTKQTPKGHRRVEVSVFPPGNYKWCERCYNRVELNGHLSGPYLEGAAGAEWADSEPSEP